ncbi:MAG: hypothetical protein MK207_14850 [Saprospiraceae bacterium]|nr:hypothetical protein [Saprospiraceae bacterium]
MLKKLGSRFLIIRINGDFTAIDFNWVAMAKVKENALEVKNNYSEAERNAMLSKVKTENATIDFESEHIEAAKRKNTTAD